MFPFMKNHSTWLQKLWTTLANNGMQRDAKTNKATLSAYPTMANLTFLLPLSGPLDFPLFQAKKRTQAPLFLNTQTFFSKPLSTFALKFQTKLPKHQLFKPNQPPNYQPLSWQPPFPFIGEMAWSLRDRWTACAWE